MNNEALTFEQPEIEVKEQVTPEVIIETKTNLKDTEKGIDLFEEFAKPTDKDLIKKENPAGNINNDTPAASNSISNVSGQLDNHALVAELTVASINVALGMVLQFISDDWSEEGENRYSLTPKRKKELVQPLSLMLENSKKKYNPVLILVITIIITYVPLFINAFRFRNDTIKKKRKLIKDGKTAEAKTEKEITTEQKETKKETPAETKETSKEYSIKEFNKIQNEIAARIKEIKSKRGKRNASDAEFMKQFGL